MLQNKIKELESINSSMELELEEKITELETQKGYEEELTETKNNIKDFGANQDKLWVTDGRLTIIVNEL